MIINGGFVIRTVLYFAGFTLGVTFGSWLAFALFLNDSPPWLFRTGAGGSAALQSNDAGSLYNHRSPPSMNDAVSIDIVKIKFKPTSGGDQQTTYKNLKILCVVVFVTGDVARLHAVNSTFGARCAKTVYYSPSYKARGFDVVWIDSDNSGYGSWQFFQKMLKRLFADLGNESYDWLIHTDDRTYLIYDNLKLFLSRFRSQDPLFIGNLQSSFIYANYFLHDAGFVLSNNTLSLLNKHMDSLCNGFWYPNRMEYALTKCLRSLGVQAIDGADPTKGGHRFLPRGPKDLFSEAWWSLKWQDPSKCCSDTAISFGQLSTKEFYLLEYILYKLEPVGIIRNA